MYGILGETLRIISANAYKHSEEAQNINNQGGCAASGSSIFGGVSTDNCKT